MSVKLENIVADCNGNIYLVKVPAYIIPSIWLFFTRQAYCFY